MQDDLSATGSLDKRPALESYLRYMAAQGASDIFLTTGAPPSVKAQGEVRRLTDKPLAPGLVRRLAYEIMTPKQQAEFERNLELNFGTAVSKVGRFRVNVYVQRGEVSMVIRFISHRIPELETLRLPAVVKELVTARMGLVLVVGSTGMGKSTTLASMINHRNATMTGHILTIEDPIEFTFSHNQSIVGQREVGIDTLSYENALREAMRESPDVIMVGEIRDELTMQAALRFADTGHLVLSTLHAVNANQALDRVVNLFPAQSRNRILMDLSLNLRAIVSQRLLRGLKTPRIPAVEVMLNTPFIAELIRDGKVGEIKEIMGKTRSTGMQTFDQSLLQLYEAGEISREEALANADSRNDLEWKINFGGGVEGASTGNKPKTTETAVGTARGTQAPRSPSPAADRTPAPALGGRGTSTLHDFDEFLNTRANARRTDG
ncbi:MAG: PilT/PilU family type 4a pilus ATPase [Thiotrichales bacterium]